MNTYSGSWINWSYGYARGATLTLPQQPAGYLSSFLAVFVSFAGGMFWRILSYCIHQANTTLPSHHRDGLHLTRQVILRNSNMGGAGAAWSLALLGFSFKDKVPRAVLRTLPFALVAAISTALFAVSSVFTSYVTSVPGNSSLIVGPHCGGFQYQYDDSSYTSFVALGKALTDTTDGATYASQCYDQDDPSLQCGIYARPRLPFTTHQNVSCPFAPGLCRNNDRSAFAMDTGLLDSHEHFGINAEPKNRIQWRRLTTCSPVAGTSFINSTNHTTDGLTIDVNAGPNNAVNTNYTFRYHSRAAEANIGYQLSSVTGSFGQDEELKKSRWEPDASLTTTDGEITLMMLAQNTIVYRNPSDDPWIPAHLPISDGSDLLRGDAWVSLLGCVDQFQICNPNKDKKKACTDLGSLSSVSTDVDNPNEWNAIQIATIKRFLIRGIDKIMYYNLHGRNEAALKASQMSFNKVQYYLPPNQWQIEVTNWFATSLAKEQAWSVEWATAPKNFVNTPPPNNANANANPGWKHTPPTNDAEHHLCQNQLVHNTGTHKSISILGLILIFVIGGLIIITGAFIDTIGSFLQKRGSKKHSYKADQWMVEETQELHKAAYRCLGLWGSEGDCMSLPPSSIFLSSDVKGRDHELVALHDSHRKSSGARNSYVRLDINDA